MQHKVIKSGHSLAVTIPSTFVKMMGVRKGDDVEVVKRPNTGFLIFHFHGAQQLTFKDRISPEKKGKKVK